MGSTLTDLTWGHMAPQPKNASNLKVGGKTWKIIAGGHMAPLSNKVKTFFLNFILKKFVSIKMPVLTD